MADNKQSLQVLEKQKKEEHFFKKINDWAQDGTALAAYDGQKLLTEKTRNEAEYQKTVRQINDWMNEASASAANQELILRIRKLLDTMNLFFFCPDTSVVDQIEMTHDLKLTYDFVRDPEEHADAYLERANDVSGSPRQLMSTVGAAMLTVAIVVMVGLVFVGTPLFALAGVVIGTHIMLLGGIAMYFISRAKEPTGLAKDMDEVAKATNIKDYAQITAEKRSLHSLFQSIDKRREIEEANAMSDSRDLIMPMI